MSEASSPATGIPKVGFVSLGCPKALTDSELILTRLSAEGYQTSKTFEGADLVIVNTCGFIDSAVQESLGAIGEALAENGKVLVTGCLGAKKDEIVQIHPNVLGVTGAHAYEEVLKQVHEHLPPSPTHNPFTDLVPPQGIKLTPRHYAYLKISEGCNHSCSFCIIPDMRGKLVSRPIGQVMGEAERLVKAGVKELLVISQDTSAYGVDIKHRTDFWDGRPLKTDMYQLAAALGELGVWVRLHYVYPYLHVDNVIPLMAQGKVLPYLDIPFQHASPTLLRKMRRPGQVERTLERIKSWREQVPNLTIRSTFIVGFPGETEAEFEELLDFLQEAQLDRVGCFAYSAVEGATANQLPDAVPEEIKEDRRARFMQLQEDISRQRLAAKVGKTMTVMIDQVTDDGVIARSSADAPEIDGLVYVEVAGEVQPGDFIEVEITGSDAHDLFAVAVPHN